MKKNPTDKSISNIFPLEILFKIFDELPLNKVVKFREVSQEFSDFVDQYLNDELQIKEIACGQFHSLILLNKGRVFVMGANKHGQLGLIDAENQFTPTEIENIERIDQLSAGFSHSVLLSKEKHLWVMGNNKNKQLAFADANSEAISLQKISGSAAVQAIAVDFTTAYISTDQVVHSYGIDKLKPHLIRGQLKLLPDWVKIPEHLDIVDISVGKEHALLLSSQGAVYGIGSNDQGLLGLGESASCDDWTILPIAKAIKIKTTSIASLILTTDNELIVSGINSAQQLGGNSKNLTSFKTIASGVINFDANDFHTLYFDANNQLHALGRNDEGQLGLGKATAKNPVPAGLLLAKQEASKQFQTSKAAFALFFKLDPALSNPNARPSDTDDFNCVEWDEESSSTTDNFDSVRWDEELSLTTEDSDNVWWDDEPSPTTALLTNFAF